MTWECKNIFQRFQGKCTNAWRHFIYYYFFLWSFPKWIRFGFATSGSLTVQFSSLLRVLWCQAVCVIMSVTSLAQRGKRVFWLVNYFTSIVSIHDPHLHMWRSFKWPPPPPDCFYSRLFLSHWNHLYLVLPVSGAYSLFIMNWLLISRHCNMNLILVF